MPREPLHLNPLQYESGRPRPAYLQRALTHAQQIHAWHIIPTNEGQELGYVERFKGTEAQLRGRMESMYAQLQRAMPQATIACRAHIIGGSEVVELLTNANGTALV